MRGQKPLAPYGLFRPATVTFSGPCDAPEAQRILRRHLPVIGIELRQQDTQDAVFHGCWDWHSAVHGHLAMLLGSDALGWKAQVQWLCARLTAPAMGEVFRAA